MHEFTPDDIVEEWHRYPASTDDEERSFARRLALSRSTVAKGQKAECCALRATRSTSGADWRRLQRVGAA
jgi:hypothetical protein